MRAASRWTVAVLVPSGTLAGHVLGYLLAGEDATLSGPHSHLRPAAWAAVALTAAALAGAALAPRRDSARSRLPWLVSAQVILFCALEGTEHLGAGHGAMSLLGERSFQWGVAAQLVTAAALLAAARLAGASGERLRALLHRSPGAPPHPRRRLWWPHGRVVRRPTLVTSTSQRGPPGRPAPA